MLTYGMCHTEDGLDDEVGVAVDFGEEEDEEGDEFEIRDNDSDDDDGEEAAVDAELHGQACTPHTSLILNACIYPHRDLVAMQGADVAAEQEGVAKDGLDPRQIDAFWLQRELSKFYEDAVTSQKRAQEVCMAQLLLKGAWMACAHMLMHRFWRFLRRA